MIFVYVFYLLATQLLGIVCSQILSHRFIDVILDMFLACFTEIPVSIILSYKIFAICTNWHCINLQVLQFHCYLSLNNSGEFKTYEDFNFSNCFNLQWLYPLLHYTTTTILSGGCGWWYHFVLWETLCRTSFESNGKFLSLEC